MVTSPPQPCSDGQVNPSPTLEAAANLTRIAPASLHESETAGQHLIKHVALTSADETVASVVAALREQTYESAEAVYVVDESQRLRGIVPLRDLLGLPGSRRIGDIMRTDCPTVLADEDQETLALLALKHRLTEVPVVDSERHLLGVVPDLALIDILRREHMEDLHRLTGILRETNHVHEALEGTPLRRLRGRLPWLLVGLLGSIVATFVMTEFEATLHRRLAIAFFIPAIVYLADAIGTQTEAIAVRYLSHGHAPLPRLLFGELATGLLLGACLCIVIFPLVVLGFNDLRLAAAVSLAVLAAGGFAASSGLLFPWLLSWAEKDPAFGSGPVATVIQDVASLLIYLCVAVLIVR